MKAQLEFNNQPVVVDFSKPLDISLPLRSGKNQPRAWYVDPLKIEPVKSEAFTGSVKLGGSVNFNNIWFNPHGHGTHTECAGHITPEVHSVNQNLKQYIHWARLISIKPEVYSGENDIWRKDGDRIITKNQLQSAADLSGEKAIIIRTLPNNPDKKTMDYCDTNPAYLEPEAISWLIEKGIDHLLLDLPSVDRESDGGLLKSHHTFWEVPHNVNLHRTITELIFVPDEVEDGLYLLNLQIAPFENDASPSKPVLYKPLL